MQSMTRPFIPMPGLSVIRPAGLGKVFFVDATNGSDSNGGQDPGNALASITKALQKCTSHRDDYIMVIDYRWPGTGIEPSFPIELEKDSVHIISTRHMSLNCYRYASINGGGENVFRKTGIATHGISGVEIAGFNLYSAGAAGIFIDGGLGHAWHIHHNSFAGLGAMQDGIYVGNPALSCELQTSLIEYNQFGDYLTRDGIRTNNHGGGSLTWSWIISNVFRKCTVGIHYRNHSLTAYLGGALHNYFYKSDGSAGWAITLGDQHQGGPVDCLIDDNHAAEDGDNPSANPYKDFSENAVGDLLNGWGANYAGIVTVEPAVSGG